LTPSGPRCGRLLARCALLALLLFGSRAAQAAADVPFAYGEHLKYDVSWSGIPVGKASLRVSPVEEFEGREVFRITSKADSIGFMSYFFPVEDRVESIVDANGIFPYRLDLKQRHGRRRMRKQITFDHVAHEATLVSGDKRSVHEIPPHAQDMLSSLYYFRTLKELKVGNSVLIDIHESKKTWRTEIQVLQRERLELPAGSFNTLKLRALFRFEGLLMTKGDAYIWVTDDERRIPVQLEGRIAIGSIRAALEQVDRPPAIRAGSGENPVGVRRTNRLARTPS
jgi:hypothetical protein